jgi:cytochrome c peroxidase
MERNENLTDYKARGGILFFGEGHCVTCRSGSYFSFSDFKFRVVIFSQSGFGANGFGIDYGRFTATFDARDLYKFQPPALYYIVGTGLAAIIGDFDPLQLVKMTDMDNFARYEFYKRLTLSSEIAITGTYLSDAEGRKRMLLPTRNCDVLDRHVIVESMAE